MNTGKVVLGVLAGLAAGAALGILFAPDKGSATRRKISDKGSAYADELGDKLNEFIDSMNAKFDSLREKATRIVENELHKAEQADATATNSKHVKI